MRFLVDECLSIHLVDLLTAAGHDVTHVNNHGLSGRPDESVLAQAVTDNRILISADTDFGEILARTRSRTPSVILFRRADRSATALAQVLLANLAAVSDELDQGSFVVITEDRIRIRRLPVT